MLMFSYGSNLCIEHMNVRCPRAIPLGRFDLKHTQLVFRGVADAVFVPGEASCPGGIWRITAACEAALDRYEGIGSGAYRKEIVDLTGVEGETEMMLYSMNSTGIFPPSQSYLDTIIQGYRDFKLPLKYLRAAVAASWDDKAPSHLERKRHGRNGRPELALSKTVPVRKARKAATTGLPTTGNLFGD